MPPDVPEAICRVCRGDGGCVQCRGDDDDCRVCDGTGMCPPCQGTGERP